MGRPCWATPEQTEFLTSFLPGLEDEKKKGNGLQLTYNRISKDFLVKWPVNATAEEVAETPQGQDSQKYADSRRTKVCLCPS
jgi:hypothetical protein